MAKVKVNTTLAGSYGIAQAGDVVEVSEDAAKAIVEAGNGTLVSDKESATNVEKVDSEKSVRITDKTAEKKKDAGPVKVIKKK